MKAKSYIVKEWEKAPMTSINKQAHEKAVTEEMERLVAWARDIRELRQFASKIYGQAAVIVAASEEVE
jgi:putative NADH-flavin reductase